MFCYCISYLMYNKIAIMLVIKNVGNNLAIAIAIVIAIIIK